MRRALELGARGRYTTSPNPRVGAVIVRPGGPTPVVVGEAYHRRAGEPHAEVIALDEAGQAARQGCLYVNLEPCCHHGRTPPCVDAILAAGIARVVVAIEDPFPEVRGASIRRLRESGVQVEVGVCEEEARGLNRFFCSVHRRGRPWVILKMAMSLDGKIATRSGDSRWISCERSRAIVHDLRAEVDAVLIGSGTALRDRPRLTARPERLSVGEFSQPRRVVLDTRGRLLSQLDAVEYPAAGPLEILVGPDVKRSAAKGTSESTVRVTEIPTEGGHIRPQDVLSHLASEDVLSVMIEGGQGVASAFLDAGLVDEMVLFVAPIVIGGTGAPALFAGRGVDRIADVICLKEMNVERIDRDILIRARLSDWP